MSINVSFDVLILVGRVIVGRRKLDVILLKKFKVAIFMIYSISHPVKWGYMKDAAISINTTVVISI